MQLISIKPVTSHAEVRTTIQAPKSPTFATAQDIRSKWAVKKKEKRKHFKEMPHMTHSFVDKLSLQCYEEC